MYVFLFTHIKSHTYVVSLYCCYSWSLHYSFFIYLLIQEFVYLFIYPFILLCVYFVICYRLVNLTCCSFIYLAFMYCLLFVHFLMCVPNVFLYVYLYYFLIWDVIIDVSTLHNRAQRVVSLLLSRWFRSRF